MPMDDRLDPPVGTVLDAMSRSDASASLGQLVENGLAERSAARYALTRLGRTCSSLIRHRPAIA